MSLGLLGNKIGMTQIFDESGNIIPVTILKIGPCVVTQIKTILTDGYNAIQVGYGSVSKKYLNQPELGHLQKANIQPLKYLKEFHVFESNIYEIGQKFIKEKDEMVEIGEWFASAGAVVIVATKSDAILFPAEEELFEEVDWVFEDSVVAFKEVPLEMRDISTVGGGKNGMLVVS